MKIIHIVLICVGVVFTTALCWLWTPDKDRAELERHYLNTPSDMIDVAGTRLHVRDSGPKTAPAVIFLHGFGASLQTWEPWANALAKDLRVIRIDACAASHAAGVRKGTAGKLVAHTRHR